MAKLGNIGKTRALRIDYGNSTKNYNGDRDKENPTQLSWLQNITSRRILVLFEAMSSKECSTFDSFTILMQKL